MLNHFKQMFMRRYKGTGISIIHKWPNFSFTEGHSSQLIYYKDKCNPAHSMFPWFHLYIKVL